MDLLVNSAANVNQAKETTLGSAPLDWAANGKRIFSNHRQKWISMERILLIKLVRKRLWIY